jgi:hypothetical protein
VQVLLSDLFVDGSNIINVEACLIDGGSRTMKKGSKTNMTWIARAQGRHSPSPRGDLRMRRINGVRDLWVTDWFSGAITGHRREDLTSRTVKLAPEIEVIA